MSETPSTIIRAKRYIHVVQGQKFCPRGNKFMILLAVFCTIPSIYQHVRSNFPEYHKKQQAVIFWFYHQDSFCWYVCPEIFQRYFLKAKLLVLL